MSHELNREAAEREAFSVPEFARRIGASQRFVWRLVHAGDLPAVRLGRRVFIPADAFRSLLQAQGKPRDAA
jgi:excisionase family DNA binding protein